MTEQTHDANSFWKKCSSCKKPIPFSGTYFSCSVSTCNSKKLGLAFCSVPCWDAHLGFANHREADAVEERAPSHAEAGETPSESPPRRRVIVPSGSPSQVSDDVDTLVVVSKVKKFIRDNSEFSTSQCCIDALTDKIVDWCRQGIEHAKAAGRKTVMGRDIVS